MDIRVVVQPKLHRPPFTKHYQPAYVIMQISGNFMHNFLESMWPVTFTLVVCDDPPVPVGRAVDHPPDAEGPQ